MKRKEKNMKKLLFVHFAFLFATLCFIGFANAADLGKTLNGVECNETNKGKYLLYKNSNNEYKDIAVCKSIENSPYTWYPSDYIVLVCNDKHSKPATGYHHLGFWGKTSNFRTYLKNGKLPAGKDAYFVDGDDDMVVKITEACYACPENYTWDNENSKCIDPFPYSKDCQDLNDNTEREKCCKARWGNEKAEACCYNKAATFKANKRASIYGGSCTCIDKNKKWDWDKSECVDKPKPTTTDKNTSKKTDKKTGDTTKAECDTKNDEGKALVYQDSGNWFAKTCKDNNWSEPQSINIYACKSGVWTISMDQEWSEQGTNETKNSIFIAKRTVITEDKKFITHMVTGDDEPHPDINELCWTCKSGYRYKEGSGCIQEGQSVSTDTSSGTASVDVTLAQAKSKVDSYIASVKSSKRDVWKDAEGKFNTARLASDLTAGIVLGTVGGVVSGVVIKKKQVEKGFEALHCTVGGQKVAGWGDEFMVGLQR
jgi:hypothetical protein